MPNVSSSRKTVAIASDHAGVDLKTVLVKELEALGYKALDLGPSTKDSVDYPDFADKLAAELKSGNAGQGVLICGSGIGISIAANRHSHIRAALCHSEELATLSRQHNDANVLVLGARVVDEAAAKKILRAFFSGSFEGGRHQRRVDKLG